MKTEPKNQPKVRSIDISKQPYDHLLQNLKYWKIKDIETVITTLDSLLEYKYRGITELQMIANFVTVFHKDICQVNQKKIDDPTKVQVHPLIFDKVIQLKTKLKKLQKNGSFLGQKIIKSKIQDYQIKKKNLVNVQVIIPQILFAQQKQKYHQNLISKLYYSFVAYFPESHSDQSLNKKLVTFLEELYKLMKSRYFYLKQKQYFELQIQKLCTKLKKPKFIENKKRMLSGETKVKDIVYNKVSAFENLTAKRRDEEEMIKILKESQIRFNEGEANNQEKANQQSQNIEIESSEKQQSNEDELRDFSFEQK